MSNNLSYDINKNSNTQLNPNLDELSNKIKNSSAFKVSFGEDYSIYLDKEKKLGFFISNISPDISVFKQYLEMVGFLDDGLKYHDDIRIFKKIFFDNVINTDKLSIVIDDYYIVYKFVTNPYIKAVFNYLDQTSLNLTFREYIRLLKNEDFSDILNIDDKKIAKQQYIVDEEMIITTVIKIPENSNFIISLDDNKKYEINIKQHDPFDDSFDNEYNTSNVFYGDMTLDIIKQKMIKYNMIKFFYDPEIKRHVEQLYVIDIQKYNFNVSFPIYDYSLHNSIYDENYVKQIKDVFGREAEIVLKDEEQKRTELTKYLQEKDMIAGRIHALHQFQIYQKKKLQYIQKKEQNVESNIDQIIQNIHEIGDDIKKKIQQEELAWKNCDPLIQERLRFQEIFNKEEEKHNKIETLYNQISQEEENYKDEYDKKQMCIEEEELKRKEIVENITLLKKDIETISSFIQNTQLSLEEIDKEVEKKQDNCSKMNIKLQETMVECENKNEICSTYKTKMEQLEKEEQELIEKAKKIRKERRGLRMAWKDENKEKENLQKLVDEEKNTTKEHYDELNLLLEDRENILIDYEIEKKELHTLEESFVNNQAEYENIVKIVNEAREDIKLINNNIRKHNSRRVALEPDYQQSKKQFDRCNDKLKKQLEKENKQVQYAKSILNDKLNLEEKLTEYNEKQNEETDNLKEIQMDRKIIEKIYNNYDTELKQTEKECSNIENKITSLNKTLCNVNEKVQEFRKQMMKQMIVQSKKETNEINANKTLINFMKNAISNNSIDCIIDIGSKSGEFMKSFLPLKTIKNIYSIEKDISLYKQLQNNVDNSQYNNWTAMNYVISNKQDSIEYYFDGLEGVKGTFDKTGININSSTIQTKNVPMETIDTLDFSGTNIMVKIACPNNDVEIVQGMVELLESRRIKTLCIIINKNNFSQKHEFILNLLKMYFYSYTEIKRFTTLLVI